MRRGVHWTLQRWAAVLIVQGVIGSGSQAGLHYSAEPTRPLPARWAGFLLDHILLRQLADAGNGPPLRDSYVDARQRLEALEKAGTLTANAAADLGAVRVRLGDPVAAVAGLRVAAHAHPDHFQLAANLGTAWQLTGDLTQAAAALEEAVRLAPPEWREAEEWHLNLIRARAKSGAASGRREPLFGPHPPPDALAILQRLAVWLPADGRLVWELAEFAAAEGDVRIAATLLERCVSEFGLDAPGLNARRLELRAAVEVLDRERRWTQSTTLFRSSRVLLRSLDPARLPPIQQEGANPLPWALIADTEFARGGWVVPDYLQELDGKKITVTGFIAPPDGAPPAEGLTHFWLTENPIGCWYCEAPGPTRTLATEIAPGPVEPTRLPVRVIGILRVNRTDPEAYPVRLESAVVVAAD